MKRRGFTVFQLLTLLAVLGMLAAFLLPAIAKVRQAAARSQSSNNLKQIAIAVHSYHDAQGFMPPGTDKEHFSAHAKLLPYIEQDNLFKQIDFKKACDDKDNAQVRATIIKTYLSPRDPITTVIEGNGPTNYQFSAGTETSLAKNNGMFYLDSQVKLLNITDGTSNTVMVIETLKGDGGLKAVDVRRQHVQLKAADLKNLKESSGGDEWKDNKNIVGTRGSRWSDGRFNQGTFTATRGVNDELPDVDCGGEGGLSGPRTFDTVIVVGMGDGSVRTVSRSVKFQTWQNLCNASDGNAIGNDF